MDTGRCSRAINKSNETPSHVNVPTRGKHAQPMQEVRSFEHSETCFPFMSEKSCGRFHGVVIERESILQTPVQGIARDAAAYRRV